MDEEYLGRLKDALLRAKKKLSLEAAEDEKPESFGNDVDDFDEKTDESTDYGNRMSEAGALKRNLREVEAALLRIDNGTYGRCLQCGKWIDKGVLEAAPESAYCRTCKKQKRGQR